MKFFLIGFFIIAISASIVSVKTLTGYIQMKRCLKNVISALIVSGWFSPIVLNLLNKKYEMNFSGFVYVSHFFYFLFGLSFILFCTLMLRDFVWFTSFIGFKLCRHANDKYSPKNPESYALLNKTNLFCALTALILAFGALFDGLRVPAVKKIILSSEKILTETTLVQLSDIHINRYTSIQHLQKIIDKTNRLNPDIIVLTGDIFDDKFNLVKDKVDILKNLKARHGVYLVWGNHEYYRGISQHAKDIETENLHILSDNGRSFREKNIYLAGIKSPYLNDKDIKKTFQTALSNEYVILLSHYPSVFDDLKDKIDLQLSGHTHGGQIFPFHFLAKRANGYLAGLYRKDKASLYVSRGTGLWGPPLRLFAPPEITLISLKPDV